MTVLNIAKRVALTTFAFFVVSCASNTEVAQNDSVGDLSGSSVSETSAPSGETPSDEQKELADFKASTGGDAESLGAVTGSSDSAATSAPTGDMESFQPSSEATPVPDQSIASSSSEVAAVQPPAPQNELAPLPAEASAPAPESSVAFESPAPAATTVPEPAATSGWDQASAPASTESAVASNAAAPAKKKKKSASASVSKHQTASTQMKATKTASIPKIPDEAFQKKGVGTVNRFYFLRQGDTPESVSQLLFGNESKAQDVVTSLGGAKAWKTGALLYYQSPLAPTDERMTSFYQESAQPPDYHKIRAGESLRDVAKEYLGAPESWREIAMMNGIKNADHPDAGTELVLFLKRQNVQSAQVPQQPAQGSSQTSVAQKMDQAAQGQVVASKPQDTSAAPVVEKSKIDDDIMKEKTANAWDKADQKEQSLASPEFTQPSYFNLLLGILGFIGVVSAVVLLVRRNRSRHDVEF